MPFFRVGKDMSVHIQYAIMILTHSVGFFVNPPLISKPVHNTRTKLMGLALQLKPRKVGAHERGKKGLRLEVLPCYLLF
jgi:hypothetical protein